MFQAVTELRGTTALARQHQPLDRAPGEPLQTVRYGDSCAVNIESFWLSPFDGRITSVILAAARRVSWAL